MANPEHLAKLMEGVEAWNEWREENPEIKPEFLEVSLNEANLQGFNLSGADFAGADLWIVDLRGANLQEARLEQTKFVCTDFEGANLQKANLRSANLQRANFEGANLKDAILIASQATFTNFTNANLTGISIVGWGIDNNTRFHDVQCDFVYLDYHKGERRPHNPNEFFKPGDFARLIEQARDTIDLIFGDGIDWAAFASSLGQLNTEQFTVQNEGQALSIKAIESKEDGGFVIRLRSPIGVDKAVIEQEFWARYHPMLEAKDKQIMTLMGIVDWTLDK